MATSNQTTPPVAAQATHPANRLFNKRALWKLILFTPLTLGIYPVIFYTGIADDINRVASRYDGKKTMHYCLLLFVVGPLTAGIGYIVWKHRLSARMGNELDRRRINYNFSSADFWLWNVLGALIVVGPFVYIHKLAKASNLLANDYNEKG